MLIHGAYLGSAFFAMANGLGAALAALITSTRPLMTTAFAIFSLMKNLSLFNGLASLSAFPASLWLFLHHLKYLVIAIISCIFGLLAITIGTLLQKRIGDSIGLLRSNVIQATAANLFFMILTATVKRQVSLGMSPF